MRRNLCVLSLFLIFCTTAFAGVDVNLPANSRIFFSEEDCVEVIKAHYSWNIEFAASLREMEKRGKLVRYPQKVPVTIMEEKLYTRHKYYKISIYNRQTQQDEIVWTDAVRFE